MIVIKPVLRADFPLAQPHFVLFVKREGKAARTGALEGIKGAGTMHIKAVSPTDREFELTGEAVVARK